MTHRSKRARRCSYVVTIDEGATDSEVRELAHYLSTLSSADCEVVILDRGTDAEFENHRRVLRWVGRHCSIGVQYDGDLLRAAVDEAAAEKVIVATTATRYTAADIDQLCELLDRHEVVEPEEFVDPLPWWGGIDAGRILLLRGVDHLGGGNSSTFGFRKAVFRPLRAIEEAHSDTHLRRLMLQGADFCSARQVFVRRQAPDFQRWLAARTRDTHVDFSYPMKTVFFLGLLPLVVLLALFGGVRFAGSYAGVVAAASVLLALRGRIGASRFFPIRACLFAPLWMVERSIGAYWALLHRKKVEPPKRPAAGTTTRSAAQ